MTMVIMIVMMMLITFYGLQLPSGEEMTKKSKTRQEIKRYAYLAEYAQNKTKRKKGKHRKKRNKNSYEETNIKQRKLTLVPIGSLLLS